MTFDTYLLKFFCDSFQKFIGCSLHFEESYTELLLAWERERERESYAEQNPDSSASTLPF